MPDTGYRITESEQTRLAVENEALKKMLQLRKRQLNGVLEITKAVNNNFSKDGILRLLEYILRGQMKVRHMALYLHEDDWVCAFPAEARDTLSADIVQELTKFKYIQRLAGWPGGDLRPYELLIPVMHKDSPLGFLLIGDMEIDAYDSEEDRIKFIQTITNIILVALENKRLFRRQIKQERLDKELELAGRVQSTLIPTELPADERITVAAKYLPHGQIGGDYYDYIPVRDDKVAFCMCDVSGKGLSAGMLMANFQAQLRMIASRRMGMEETIRLLNQRLFETTRGEKFITMFLATYEFSTRRLEYVSAGHEVPFLINDGTVHRLNEGTMILGAFESLAAMEVGSMHLAPGAMLLTYTDGLSELADESGELFGADRLEDLLRSHDDHSPHDVLDALTDAADAYKGDADWTDDISILIARFH